jgi:hypothetical protein
MEEQTRPYSRWVSWLLMALALLILSAWLIGTPGGPLGKADAVGYAACRSDPFISITGRCHCAHVVRESIWA